MSDGIKRLEYFTVDAVDKITNLTRLVGTDGVILYINNFSLPAKIKEGDFLVFKSDSLGSIEIVSSLTVESTNETYIVIEIRGAIISLRPEYFLLCETNQAGTKIKLELYEDNNRVSKIKTLENKVVKKKNAIKPLMRFGSRV